MLTVEEAQEFIADELKKSLQPLIGQSYDLEKIKEHLLESLGHIYKSLGVTHLSSEIEALSELLVVGFLGMPEKFDPKAILSRVSDSTLALMASRLGSSAFPANLLSVEWMKRSGNIVDWEFQQDGTQAANIILVPKYSLNRIAFDLLADPEEKN